MSVPLIGANVHAPSKEAAPKEQWEATRALLSALPPKTPVRGDGLWHELNWDSRTEYGSENLRAKLEALSIPGGTILLTIIPLPWPGSWGWTTHGPWGYVDEREIPLIAKRFARMIEVIKIEAKALGISESRIVIQPFNEMAAGHPGGWAHLPQGEWWDRHGRLLVACFKLARFGRMKVAAPPLSMQDHPEVVARRERETAAPILKAIARYCDYSSVHSRTYAPHLGTVAYAEIALKNLRERMALASSLTGGRPPICSELYVFEADRGANADAPEVWRYLAPRLPDNVWVYHVGGGSGSPTTSVSLETFRRISAERTATVKPPPK